MLNKAMLIGRLGKDPEVKTVQAGTVAKLSLATDESYNDRDGNKVQRTEWHNIIVWNKQAENCQRYLHKGSLVYVEGKLQTRKYTDKNGNERYVTEIRAERVQFLDPKDKRDGSEKHTQDDDYDMIPF